MKHSTFYTAKKQKKVYTTIKLTDYHEFLREKFEGVTYEHEDNAKLYFVAPNLPLDQPLGKFKRV